MCVARALFFSTRYIKTRHREAVCLGPILLAPICVGAPETLEDPVTGLQKLTELEPKAVLCTWDSLYGHLLVSLAFVKKAVAGETCAAWTWGGDLC